MKIGFTSETNLGLTLAQATRIRGFETCLWGDCDLLMVTQDVLDHSDLSEVDRQMRESRRYVVPVVLVSQVPPGYTRRYQWDNLYYQVDTIIVSQALRRCVFPERIVVGCRHHPDEVLPKPYADYLAAFECPIIQMTYESAEVVKLAVNKYLADQIATTNKLKAVADKVGADWSDVVEGVRLDRRIGAYLSPGKPNQHLLRDCTTLDAL